MPSGMPYYRAIPQTWINALFAREFGLENEISYRLFSAIIGSLTIPLIFLFGRPIFGFSIALVAALMMSFSEWHILISREARMYGPFLFFYIASSLSIWRWASTQSRRHLIFGVIFFLAALSFHYLSIILTLIFIIPLAYPSWSRVPPWQYLILALFVGATAEYYNDTVIGPAYSDWILSHGEHVNQLLVDESVHNDSWLPSALATHSSVFLLGGILIGTVLGGWFVRQCLPDDTLPGYRLRALALYFLGILSASFAIIGQLYGAGIIALTFFLIHPERGSSIIRSSLVPGLVIVLISSVWILSASLESGFLEGLKSLTTYPFRYPALLAKMLPGTMFLFVVVCLFILFDSKYATSYPLRVSAVAALIPVIGIGVMRETGGSIRYVVESYPFLVYVAAAGLLQLTVYLAKAIKLSPDNLALPLAGVIVISGSLGGHGIPQALGVMSLDYGESVPSFPYEYYPDNKGAGEFVKKNLAPGDIVIAEDYLAQHWYVGQVDYALRDLITDASYLYKAPDGIIRDYYVNSTPATPDVLSRLDRSSRRIWLITSAQVAPDRQYYLNEKQRHWLGKIERENAPVFVGRDNLTKVYCLNCGSHRDS